MSMWMDVKHIPSSHTGGSMVGGPPRWVWHTYEADPRGLSADRAARNLIAAGNEVHFTFNPLTGDIVQILPANVAGRGLMNRPGGVETNRMGSACIQIEVIAYARDPWTRWITPAGEAGLAKLIVFARSLGIPDTWPAGSPPAYPPGSGNRSVAKWVTQAGHYGHSQVPENDHGDPGELDIGFMFSAAIATSIPTQEMGSMDLYRDPDGHIWDIGAAGRRYITQPAVVAAYQAKGGQIANMDYYGINSIPRIPDGGITIPPAPSIDVDALAAALAGVINGISAAEIVDLMASRLKD